MTTLVDCPPRFATSRTEARQTLGPRVAEIAHALGTPLMPWQRTVADVALEVDDSGELHYTEVRLTVPRQSGKTTLLLAVMVHRALAFGSAQAIVYTAQNGVAARSKFVDEHLPILKRSAFEPMFRSRLTTGHEAVLWANGSRHTITAGTEKAGHGQTLDLAVIDEAFAQIDHRLEQAFRPAMNTRTSPQLWIVSTAGTVESSPYLLKKVEDGRARVESGADDRVAYFEWSAPDDADPLDPGTWFACMPALGHTTPVSAIEGALASGMDHAEFSRAYLNRWNSKSGDDSAFPLESWTPLADRRSRALDPIAFAVDVSPDRSTTSIASAGLREDGLLHVEVVDHRPGTAWVPDRLAELVDRWQPLATVLDSASPAASLLPDLERLGIEVGKYGMRDVGQAAGLLYDHVANGTLRHLDQANLNAAVAGCRRRQLGDMWALARRGSSTDISPLVAVTLAAWAFANRPGTGTPEVIFI